ncbi:uncharacterized protein METZ01_LOCUS137709 [marine metagenome]|uniref:Baseplate protein n=1 Tax=marine metagenome TaxID=408172 RepID=A0A381Z6C6_9ZZZZ
MSLPKINTPEYTLVVPSTDEEVKFRPFLVKEEKVLLIAQETGTEYSLYQSIKNLVSNCCFGKIDVDTLPLFDIEYIFIQIRAKSVGEVTKIQVICPDDEETTVMVEVDISKLQVQMDEKHNPRIQLTDDIGILMSYPNLATVLSMKQDNEKEGNVDAMFQMIQDCMYQIWQGEETFDTTDYSDKDKQEFLDSLNHEQFEKLQTFFETMPTLKHEVEVINPKTQVKSKVVLEGMNSFF